MYCRYGGEFSQRHVEGCRLNQTGEKREQQRTKLAHLGEGRQREAQPLGRGRAERRPGRSHRYLESLVPSFFET